MFNKPQHFAGEREQVTFELTTDRSANVSFTVTVNLTTNTSNLIGKFILTVYLESILYSAVTCFFLCYDDIATLEARSRQHIQESEQA